MEVPICSSVHGGSHPTIETVVGIRRANGHKKATEEDVVTGTVGLMLSRCPSMTQFVGLLSHSSKYLNATHPPSSSRHVKQLLLC